MYFDHGYALLIGVGRTKNSAGSLPVTVKDAEVISSILTDAIRCAYRPEHVCFLHDEGATRQAIRDALDALAQKVQADPDATAIVYFSGHGWKDEEATPPRYYLIPHDYDSSDIPGSAISEDEFTTKLRAIKARKLVVVLDACHSGGTAEPKLLKELLPEGFTKAAPSTESLLQKLEAGSGRVVLSSSRENERSFIRPDLGHSIFTHHLLEALSGKAPTGRTDQVGVLDVFTYLDRMVPPSALKQIDPFTGKPAQQHPVLDGAKTDNFPIALLLGGKGLPLAQQLPPEREVEPRLPTPEQGAWNIAMIRKLLKATFNDETLEEFCRDYFPEVKGQFSRGMSVGEKISRLIDYCDRHLSMSYMLELVREVNEEQYQRFRGQLRK